MSFSSVFFFFSSFTFLLAFLALFPFSHCFTISKTNGTFTSHRQNQLSVNYYAKSCPQVDQLVASITSLQFRDVPVSAPATIRLFFHDCFVDGCDASILISTKPGSKDLAEKDAEDNKDLPMEGFDSIKKAKALVESKCPGVVSCADILAIAARDFVHLVFQSSIPGVARSFVWSSHVRGCVMFDSHVVGLECNQPTREECVEKTGGPYYQVKKGRWDGKLSMASRVQYNIPKANSTVDELIRLFKSKGLTVDDLVVLSGAHTIGFAHCKQFVERLYNHRGTRQPDPSMDPRLLKALKMSCPEYGGNTDVVAPFDVTTTFAFDNAYYGNLESKMGLLASDQALFLDSRTRALVQSFSRDKQKFFQAFATAMDKMGSIGVKRGPRHGERRKECSMHV